jgi:hypothetical protein
MSPAHRTEAERHLANAARHLTEEPGDMRIAEVAAWIGQGYATLARDEEQAARTADLRDANTLLRRRECATREAVATHIAKGLASREPARWSAAIELNKTLDDAGLGLDDLVDDRLTEDGWDPRSAYKTPASLVPHDDPWAAKPNITGDVPEPVRRVIADRLADMLLSREDDGWHAEQARRFAFALKAEGADLTGDIEKRIRELTLGADPSDPPF